MEGGKHMPTIISLFAATVERFPNRVALIEPTAKDVISTLTYRELKARAQGFAGYLQNLQQLASHQQIRGFTVWPETDFPHTHTLKVKRLDVLSQLEKMREPS
jgi:long-subunit acyl-CoA synthetase (AMP-forming)